MNLRGALTNPRVLYINCSTLLKNHVRCALDYKRGIPSKLELISINLISGPVTDGYTRYYGMLEVV
jgi:hypothetical protein